VKRPGSDRRSGSGGAEIILGGFIWYEKEKNQYGGSGGSYRGDECFASGGVRKRFILIGEQQIVRILRGILCV
jgi:hypothetical protein